MVTIPQRNHSSVLQVYILESLNSVCMKSEFGRKSLKPVEENKKVW